MLALLLATACPAALPAQVSAFAGTRKYTISVDTMGVLLPVALPADSIWQLLPSVYEKLGLPLDEKGTAGMRFGTCWKRVRGRLGGAPLSRYLDCGELRQMPNADARDVDLLVLTAVREENGVTGVATVVMGWASSPDRSGSRQWCQSRGALEKRIQEALVNPPQSY
jgi:hypothetical protein